jgi:hypothetical protein
MILFIHTILRRSLQNLIPLSQVLKETMQSQILYYSIKRFVFLSNICKNIKFILKIRIPMHRNMLTEYDCCLVSMKLALK